MRVVFMGTPDFAVPSLQALLDDLRVYKLDHFLRVLVDVEQHDDAAENADLRRRQTDTARVFERFAHIVDQHMQTVVELFYRTTVLAQLLVALDENFAKCHVIFPPNSVS